MNVTDVTQETDMGNQDVSKYVTDNQPDMLHTKSLNHKEDKGVIPDNHVENDACNTINPNIQF